MRRRGIIIVGVVAAVAALLIAFNLVMPMIVKSAMSSQQRPPLAVSAIKAEAVTWTPGIDAVGTAKAGSGADIAVQTGGVVKSIGIVANQRVLTGQVLVQIDDSIEQADMAAAQASMKLAQADVARITPLVTRGASTQAALDDAQAKLDTAQAQFARAKAVADQKAMTAPFSGVVGVPRVVVGQYVTPGTVVVTLQDIDRILVDFTVPEQSAGDIKVGQKARFGATTESLDFSGHVTGFDPKVDPQTRLISVQALLDAPVGRILPGQFLRVRVSLPDVPNVVVLPETAVVPSLYGDYVYQVVDQAPPEGAEDQQAKQVSKQVFVKSGRRDGTRIEIQDGVKAGDMVIVSGQNRLQNGAAVTIADNVVPGAAPAGAPQ